MNFEEQLKYFTQLVDQELKEIFRPSEFLYHKVEDAMWYSIQAGGKRLRPILTLSVCQMLQGDQRVALPFACAVETIHTSSLIHDDLPCMDDDDLRRGKPSCHIAFGEDVALLAGDGLLLRAFEILSGAISSGATPQMVAEGVRILSTLAGPDGMVGGQMIDLSCQGTSIDETTLEQMHCLKTGALIQAACQLGGAAAGADSKMQQHLKQYAQALGLAFQICDDLLDVEGDETLLGKPIGSDAQQQKTTYVTLHGVCQAKELAYIRTQQAEQELNYLEQLSLDVSFLRDLTRFLLQRDH